MNIGIVGCGRIAKNHIIAAVELGLEVVGLCDIDLNKAKKLKEDYDLKNAVLFESYLEMFSKDLDIVSIATPNGDHYKVALEALRNDLNVIIEKPVALSLSEIHNLIRIKDERGLKVSVCHQNRFNKSIQKVKKTIDSGNLGKIHYISAKVFWYRDKGYYSQSSWRGSKLHLDGALLNQSIHNIDLLLWLMNSKIRNIKSVTRNFIHPEIEMEDFGAALIEFENGSVGFFEATTSAYPKNLEESLYIFAEKGTIKIGGQSVNRIDEWRVDNEIEPIEEIQKKHSESPENIYGNGHIALYKDFVESIKADREPAITLQDGRNAVEVILAIYESSFEKNPI